MSSRFERRLTKMERLVNTQTTHAGVVSVPAMATDAEIAAIISTLPPQTHGYSYLVAPATANPADWPALVAQHTGVSHE